jgi:hypothetical protein
VSYDPLAQLADTLREQLTPTARVRLTILSTIRPRQSTTPRTG